VRAKLELHAAKLAAIMITYPSTHGVFSVNVENDGLHSQAAWAIDATVYTAYDGHSDANAADLVESMQP